MATGNPPIDFYHEFTVALRERFEKAAFPEGGMEDCEGDAGRIYNEEFKRPYVCALMADVVSGRWKLGTSQEAISEALGITSDRGWVSRALHQGHPLSLDTYIRLRCWPKRPENWEPDIDQLKRDMDRSAFIGVARYWAGYITDRPTLAPQRLNELNYELICEMFARVNAWMRGYLLANTALAMEIIENVVHDQRRNVIPRSNSHSQRQKVEKEIQHITQSRVAAFEHLIQLQRDWLDIFATTHRVILDLKGAEV